MQIPLTIHYDGGDPTIAKTRLKALFDERPTREDVDEASRSMGYDPRSYIIGKVECSQIDDTDHDEHGLWRTRWCAILD